MKTIVESGHFYSANGPTQCSMQGWHIGKEVVASTCNADIALFIDDYHDDQPYIEPGDKFLDKQDADAASQAMIAEADHVFYEAELVQSALVKVLKLLDSNTAKLKKGVVTTGGVRLGSFSDEEKAAFQPTCTFLDLIFLYKKAELGQKQVVVLPESYRSQQTQLATVLSKNTVPNLTSYAMIFHSLMTGRPHDYVEARL